LILNRQKLEGYHRTKSSKLVLSALSAAIDSVTPDYLIRRAVKFSNDKLTTRDIYGNVIDLSGFNHVYIVGAGKAALGMASTFCSLLDNKVAAGAITIPYGIKTKKIKRVLVTRASHPVPDNAGVAGTRRIISTLRKAKAGDLVVFLLSGGGSALMPMPASGISLVDKQKITGLLLRSGASIHEINTIRKHLSAVKGGQILRHVGASCSILSLIISDVIGDDLGIIASGPTYHDNSTFGDALNILQKYHIKSPANVIDYLFKGARGMIPETPKPQEAFFSHIHNIIIGNNAVACKAAEAYFRKRRIRAVYLGSEFNGQAKEFGSFLAHIILDARYRHLAIVAGGETTVKLDRRRSGIGGRNQEAALSCLMHLNQENVAIGCMGTDGIDGNSDAAGALVSSKTIMLAKKMDLQKYLNRHDSYHAFRKLNSLIYTGFTGTNVNDISIICPEIK